MDVFSEHFCKLIDGISQLVHSSQKLRTCYLSGLEVRLLLLVFLSVTQANQYERPLLNAKYRIQPCLCTFRAENPFFLSMFPVLDPNVAPQ